MTHEVEPLDPRRAPIEPGCFLRARSKAGIVDGGRSLGATSIIETAAEYIQATSRVGREGPKPGLVVTLLNIHKPRDRTHFEQFRAFHMSFYRAVEATSVTPYADRALDRALAATMVAAIRHVEPDLTPSKAADRVEANEQAFAVVDAIVREKLSIAVQPNELEAVSARCLGRLATLNDALIDIADKQTANGDEFAYDKAEPARRLLQDPLDPLPASALGSQQGARCATPSRFRC